VEAVEPALAVLVQSARARNDRHDEVLPRLAEFGAKLVPLIDDTRAAALLEWWLICGLGFRGTAQHAYTMAPAELGLPEHLADAVNAVLWQCRAAEGVPILDWIVERRELDRDISQLKSRLYFSKADEGRKGTEHHTWEEMVGPYREAIEALEAGRLPDDPGWKSNDFGRFLRGTTVWDGSTLDKGFKSKGVELAELTTRAIRRAARLKPLHIDLDARAAGLGNLDQVDAGLRPIAALLLADLFEGGVDTEAPARTALVKGIEARGTVERNRLALICIDWLEHSPREVPALSENVRRYLQFSEQVAEYQRKGVDTEVASIHLDDGHFNDAEKELGRLAQRGRQQQQEADLQARYLAIDRLLNEASSDEGLAAEFVQRIRDELLATRQAIGSRDAAELRGELSALQGRIELERSAAQSVRAAEVLEELRSISDDDLDELLDHYQQGLDDGELSPDDLEAIDSLLESTRADLNRSFDQLHGRFVDRFEEVRDQLAPDQVTAGSELLEQAQRLGDIVEPDGRDLREMVTALASGLRRLEQSVLRVWKAAAGERELVEHIVAYVCDRAGFSEFDVRRFHAAVKAKRFVVLAGLTGTGKSTLARLYAESLDISVENEQFVRVAVRPNWIDQSEVLGYVNPINNVFQPGWLASMLVRCRRNPTRLHVCVLDEMNLAPAEQYLADVLSAIEEEGAGAVPRVSLYPPDARPHNREDWPPTLPLPANLIFVGTVNIDESTRALTDRVVDRGHMIQLSVEVGRQHHREERERLEPRWRVEEGDWSQICTRRTDPSQHDFLIAVAETMQRMRIGVGIRSHIEIERFLSNAADVMDADEALDVAMLQRLIPKIRGYRRDLAQPLQTLLEQFREVGAERCQRVIEHWLDEDRSDDEYLEGTDPFLGVVTS
jgi:MoxR-like ATPase